MRPKSRMRTSRRVYAAAFAVMLAIPATAVALTARPSTGGTAAVAPTDTTSAIKANLTRRHVGYGKPRDGRRAQPRRPQPGQRLELRSTTVGSHSWRTVASATRAPRRQLPDDHPDASVREAAGRERGGGGEHPAAGHGRRPARAPDGLGRRARPVTRAPSAASCCRRLGSQGAPRGRQSDGSWRLLSTAAPVRAAASGCSYAGGDASKLRVHFTGDRQNTRAAQARR